MNNRILKQGGIVRCLRRSVVHLFSDGATNIPPVFTRYQSTWHGGTQSVAVPQQETGRAIVRNAALMAVRIHETRGVCSILFLFVCSVRQARVHTHPAQAQTPHGFQNTAESFCRGSKWQAPGPVLAAEKGTGVCASVAGDGGNRCLPRNVSGNEKMP